MSGSTYPLRVTRALGLDHQKQPRKQPVKSAPTFNRWISQTTWSLEMKFCGDDEHPKKMLCPKNLSLKHPTTPGITNLGQEHYELGFIRKSTNRRPNPVFEGSRSSTKRHKALTHDPLKEIWRKTLSNLRNQPKNENTKEAQKDPRKSQRRSFYTNHERFIQV